MNIDKLNEEGHVNDSDSNSSNQWYSVQNPEKPSVCLCINDGNEALHSPTPFMYMSEEECMNSECPLPPIVCEMNLSSVQLLNCFNSGATRFGKFLIETEAPEYDAVVQFKIGNGQWIDSVSYNGSSQTVDLPLSSSNEPISFRLYKYVCEDQRCFINWPNLEWDQDPPQNPKVVLKAVRYDTGDLMKITGLSYKYVPPFYIPGPGGTPAVPQGDYGQVFGGTISSDSTRDPIVGEVVKIEPESGDSTTVGAVYRIVKIENLSTPESRVITLECANYLCDDVKQNMVGWTIETIYVHNFVKEDCTLSTGDAPYKVSVKMANVPGKGQRFVFDNEYKSPYFLTRGTYYRFDLSDPSNSGNELAFSNYVDGRNGGVVDQITSPGLVLSGTPGTSGAYLDVFTQTLSDNSTPAIPFKEPAPNEETQEFFFFSKENTNKGGKITMATKTPGDDGPPDDGQPISAPCGGGHTCNRAKFYIKINGVIVLNSNLNNLGDPDSPPSSKFGGPWAPTLSGIGNNQYDRRCVAVITEEMNSAIFASGDSGESDSDGGGSCDCGDPESASPTEPFVLSIEPMEENKNPHIGVTWVRLKNRCNQTVYSCCIGKSFCPDCPPPQTC